VNETKVAGKKGQRENEKLYLFPQAFFSFPRNKRERERERRKMQWIMNELSIRLASVLVWSTLRVCLFINPNTALRMF